MKCTATRALSEEDQRRLDSLYEAESFSPTHAECDLNEGHAVHHVGAVSEQGIEGSRTTWWASWLPGYHESIYILFTAPRCNPDLCTSITGHDGDHIPLEW